MYKNYTEWMNVKREINDSNLRPLWYKERDIWICNLGENIGFEEDGKRGSLSVVLEIFCFCGVENCTDVISTEVLLA